MIRRWLAISEIEQSKILQALYWILLFGFFLSFNQWISTLHLGPSARHM